MTKSPLRWLLGLVFIAALSSAMVWGITYPMRQNLAELAVEAADLEAQEATVLKDVTKLQTAKAGAVVLPQEALWSRGQSASVEVALQEVLVSKASAAGLQLVSFGETTVPEEIVQPSLASELELVGTHDELAAFLIALEESSPPLAISYLWLRQLPPDPAQPGSPLSIRMTVWGFRSIGEAP